MFLLANIILLMSGSVFASDHPETFGEMSARSDAAHANSPAAPHPAALSAQQQQEPAPTKSEGLAALGLLGAEPPALRSAALANPSPAQQQQQPNIRNSQHPQTQKSKHADLHLRNLMQQQVDLLKAYKKTKQKIDETNTDINSTTQKIEKAKKAQKKKYADHLQLLLKKLQTLTQKKEKIFLDLETIQQKIDSQQAKQDPEQFSDNALTTKQEVIEIAKQFVDFSISCKEIAPKVFHKKAGGAIRERLLNRNTLTLEYQENIDAATAILAIAIDPSKRDLEKNNLLAMLFYERIWALEKYYGCFKLKLDPNYTTLSHAQLQANQTISDKCVNRIQLIDYLIRTVMCSSPKQPLTPIVQTCIDTSKMIHPFLRGTENDPPTYYTMDFITIKEESNHLEQIKEELSDCRDKILLGLVAQGLFKQNEDPNGNIELSCTFTVQVTSTGINTTIIENTTADTQTSEMPAKNSAAIANTYASCTAAAENSALVATTTPTSSEMLAVNNTAITIDSANASCTATTSNSTTLAIGNAATVSAVAVAAAVSTYKHPSSYSYHDEKDHKESPTANDLSRENNGNNRRNLNNEKLLKSNDIIFLRMLFGIEGRVGKVTHHQFEHVWEKVNGSNFARPTRGGSSHSALLDRNGRVVERMKYFYATEYTPAYARTWLRRAFEAVGITKEWLQQQ